VIKRKSGLFFIEQFKNPIMALLAVAVILPSGNSSKVMPLSSSFF
jgi:hypothetical protein